MRCGMVRISRMAGGRRALQPLLGRFDTLDVFLEEGVNKLV
jgi:hypothetical protein